MPYIPANERDERLDLIYAEHAGELNYQLTVLCRNYIEVHGLKYQTINDILGALEGAKAEFYRRVAAPYEDQKCAANGDVYP